MGKSQSKHACKRREGPEGGSFAANALTCQRESERTGAHINKIKLKQELCQGELKEEPQLDHDCHLEVALPPEHSSQLPASKHPRKRNSHADERRTRHKSQDAECNVVLEDDAQQEWIFTLYDFDNSGKVTKEDMSSLMHSIYEVVEASVKQPCSSSTALRLKLVLTPSASTGKTSPKALGLIGNTSQADQEQSVVQEVGSPPRRPYCVDENTERRNHYLDLAGIENYSSKFDDADSPSQESRQDARPALQRRSVVAGENGNSTESRGRGLSFLRSFRSKAKAVAGDRAGGGGKSARFHGHPPQLQLQAHVPLQRTHSKRLRPRVQDAGSPSRPPCPQGQPGGERETVPGLHASCGGSAPPTQRHEHHHEHHHHHHHHHHHYHPS